MNFAPFNAHTTPLFKNCNILKFADIINFESCVFVNNCFHKNSFLIFNENFKLVLISHSHILEQLVTVYYLYQVITQSYLGENQLSIQPLLYGVIINFSLIYFCILECISFYFIQNSMQVTSKWLIPFSAIHIILK